MTDHPIIFSAPSREYERFMALVSPEPNTGCWLWLGRVTPKGYGRFGRGEPAHRAALRLHGIPVPIGMEPDHKCRVRCCVNPDHLEPVTHRENLMRGNTLPARAALRTHCPAGHPLFGDNLQLRSGKRSCRECDRLRQYAVYDPITERRRRKHLTAEEASEVRSRIARGQTHAQIAEAMNVSIATVSNVRRGKNHYG